MPGLGITVMKAEFRDGGGAMVNKMHPGVTSLGQSLTCRVGCRYGFSHVVEYALGYSEKTLRKIVRLTVSLTEDRRRIPGH